MDTLLYQFNFSHYCEKARWALDYKGVRYQVKILLPGLHLYTLRRIVKDTSLPVLSMNGTHIQGSDHIIDFLDRTITTNLLTPVDPALRTEAQTWESFAANQLATPYAVFHYSNLLEMPDLLRQRFTQNGPWYGPLFYAVTFRRICQRIRELYNITQDSADQARATIETGLQKLEQHLHYRSYLVGDQFTRADLSVAALLSPLAMPEQLAYNRISPYPAIAEFRTQVADSPVIQWVNGIYQTHRNYLG
jgi:glutathione S-transferase